jgi:single-strand DNA-binding protein
MSGYQKVIIQGRLGQDPEMKYTASGSAVANISVATSEKWNDKQSGEKVEKTEWHRVVFFGRQAELIAEFFSKGSMILLDGKLQTDKWERDGQTHYTTKVIGRELVFQGRSDDNQQQSGAGGFRKQPDAAAPAQGKLTGGDFKDDDIPF